MGKFTKLHAKPIRYSTEGERSVSCIKFETYFEEESESKERKDLRKKGWETGSWVGKCLRPLNFNKMNSK